MSKGQHIRFHKKEMHTTSSLFSQFTAKTSSFSMMGVEEKRNFLIKSTVCEIYDNVCCAGALFTSVWDSVWWQGQPDTAPEVQRY